jgi:hypothetical protein
MDSREDGGALSWLNVRLPGSAAIGGVGKSDFLLGEAGLRRSKLVKHANLGRGPAAAARG